ncbi:Lysosome-associated membrane glycoprotein 1 [Salvia divinorum]|uniref:Lysosome-associated membrane glycoprotein 1 n=1 Tax=Salvia divinorum TaxID=28513 RepID=A0ABD1GU75_SALDI
MLIAVAAGLISVATSIFLTLPQPQPPSFYHSLFLSQSFSDNNSISHHLHSLTRRPHIAGSPANAEAAAYVLSTLTSYGIPSHIAPYHAALTYPLSRSLTLTLPPPLPPLEFSLRQEIYAGDPYAAVAGEVTPTFHAYAKSGAAVGPAVYVNYGRVEDFAALAAIGVNISGAVAVVRYGKIYRGDIVMNAQAAGAAGAVVFTDRKDYGGERWFPDDRWMPPSGVQVGSVYTARGDPTTPGWPSTEGCERITEEEVEKSGEVPLIPSLPVSWADGDAIMMSMGGRVADEDWQGGKGAGVYRVGPGPGVLSLNYEGEQVITKIENVIGIIHGAEEPDRYVILGNHRDAWTFGAVDPNSGTSCLLEVARRMWKLRKKGWKPRRTILFCNWDAEEYGLIGSVEWVEENREMLASRAVAYLNVDVAVSGAGFATSATPQLDELLVQSAMQVMDPDNSSQTIYDSWASSTGGAKIGRLGGAGSDYSAFLQHIGVPAADIGMGGGYPVYHSMYDDFVWMSKFGDPMFRRHAAVASIWGSVALRLADGVILPFNYTSYAHELQKSAEELKGQVLHKSLTLVPMFKSINEFKKAAAHINDEIKALEGSWTTMWKDGQKVREVNDRLMMAERAFTDREGLKERSWYKHLIYAPANHNGYGSTSFPGIYDAIEKAKGVNSTESWRAVQHEIWRVARVISQAALCLRGDLT